MTARVQRLLALALASLLGTSSCVLPDQLTQIQNDVADLKRQIGDLERSQRDAQRAVEELQTGAGEEDREEGTREELANIAMRLERLARETTATDEKVNDAHRRIDRISQDSRPARSGTAGRPPQDGAGADLEAPSDIAAPPRSAGAVPDPEALYNTAYLDFSKGNFDLAIAGFEEYQERFSASPLADNALYWIGECQFSKGDFQSAIRAFDRLLEGYATSDKAPAADLKKALAFQEQNLIGQAIVQLRYVITQYPDSDEARIARDKLSALGQVPS